MRKLSVYVVACWLVVFQFGCQNVSAGVSRAWDTLPSAASAFDRPDRSIVFPDVLPKNFEEFKERYQQFGTSPEGAIKMYFDAVFCYLQPDKRSEAVKMLRYSLHETAGWEKRSSNATFVSRLNNPQMHYIFRSFAEGTSPENNYAMSPDNYRLMLDGKKTQTDYTQLTLTSSGADSPRPFQLRQFEDKLWYVTSNPGSYSDVRAPREQTQKKSRSHDATYD
jgi:hypothetical protein